MQTRSEILFEILLRLYFSILLGALLVFNVYSLVLNDGNHTGFPLASLFNLYLVCSLLNLFLLTFVQLKKIPVNTPLIYWLVILSLLASINIDGLVRSLAA